MFTENLTYQDGDVQLRGFFATDKTTDEPKPLILIAHDWSGRNPFACDKAKELAALGYCAFALDMYGDAKVYETKEEKSKAIQPLLADRPSIFKRMLAGYQFAKNLPGVDKNRVAAIGFCFGGLCVLDLARNGTDLKGVVSFHGLLTKPDYEISQKIMAKILILHGFDDPMAPPESVIAFGKEMKAKKEQVDFQLHVYSNTMHAFTNPQANDVAFGTVYNPLAAQRSWLSMKNFLAEILT
jgi:dienelactone hydrolase